MICPVCNSDVESNAASCPACGYRFQEATEEFNPVSLDSPDSDVPASSITQPTLTVLNTRQVGLTYTLEGDRAVIGRSPKSTIFLNDMTVSRDHAVLELVGGSWSIKDNGSYNGVWVNNANVDHAVLHNRDVIQIGCFVLRFED